MDNDDANNRVYLIKRQSFPPWSRSPNIVPILLQDINGPCPLIAILNVLLLRGQLTLPSGAGEVTQAKAVQMLAEHLLDKSFSRLQGGSSSAEYGANLQANLSDAISLLPKLTTGIDVNVRFDGIRSFEYTDELSVFDLLGLDLVHGWLVDPQDPAAAAIGSRSYNELVVQIVAALGTDATPTALSRRSTVIVGGINPSSSSSPPPLVGGMRAPSFSTLLATDSTTTTTTSAQRIDAAALSEALKSTLRVTIPDDSTTATTTSSGGGGGDLRSRSTTDSALSQDSVTSAINKMLGETVKEAFKTPTQTLNRISFQETAVSSTSAIEIIPEDADPLSSSSAAPDLIDFTETKEATEEFPVLPASAGEDAITTTTSGLNELAPPPPPPLQQQQQQQQQEEEEEEKEKESVLVEIPATTTVPAPAVECVTPPPSFASTKRSLQSLQDDDGGGDDDSEAEDQQLPALETDDAPVPTIPTSTTTTTTTPAAAVVSDTEAPESAERTALLSREFLESNPSQLTVFGLASLMEDMVDQQLAIFFRNNHFNVLLKSGNRLYMLVTDQGYMYENDVMWEYLSNIDGDTELLTWNLQSPCKPGGAPVAAASAGGGGRGGVVSSSDAWQIVGNGSGSEIGVGVGGGTEDADFALAMQLQQEEEERVRRAEERRQASTAQAAQLQQRPPPSSASSSAQGGSSSDGGKKKKKKSSNNCTIM